MVKQTAPMPLWVSCFILVGMLREAHKSKAIVLDPSSDNISVLEELITSESRMWHTKESFSNCCKSDYLIYNDFLIFDPV